MNTDYGKLLEYCQLYTLYQQLYWKYLLLYCHDLENQYLQTRLLQIQIQKDEVKEKIKGIVCD